MVENMTLEATNESFGQSDLVKKKIETFLFNFVQKVRSFITFWFNLTCSQTGVHFLLLLLQEGISFSWILSA